MICIQISCQTGLQQFEIKPGETRTVFELKQGGRIAGIELNPATVLKALQKAWILKLPGMMKNILPFIALWRISLDMLLAEHPCRACCLAAGIIQTIAVFPCRLINRRKLSLFTGTSHPLIRSPLQVSVHVWYSTDPRIAEREGKFYAKWNKNLRSTPGKPHVFLNVNGRGHYVGTILQAQGLQAGMTYFFEGDDSASIDGSFRIHGTGSEDYFNGGWYAMMDRWDGKMSLPLHGALDYSLPFCRTGGYRLYLSDKLSFENSFYMSIEHGPAGNKFPVDYTSLALYYSDSPAIESAAPTNESS